MCCGLPVIFPLLSFPWFFVLFTLSTGSGVFVPFFPARSFQVFATSPAGGGTTVVSPIFCCYFFSFSLSICLLCFLSFLYFIECVCRACRTYHNDIALHCPLLCLLTAYLVRGNRVSLWRSFVTIELVYLTHIHTSMLIHSHTSMHTYEVYTMHAYTSNNINILLFAHLMCVSSS